MATFIEDLGIVSAYGEAVRKGYTGTEEEFAEMLANLPDKLAEAREYAASAAESSASAASSADGVQRNASIASTAASDAQSAAASALQSATFAETTVEGIEEHEEQCRIYRAEAVAAAEELKTTTLWNDALIDETVTGKIASFSDGCVGMPMKSIVAEITPVQSGSGDPSPTNIRPISGRTGLTVTRCGKNLFDTSTLFRVNDNTFRSGFFYLPSGTYTFSRPSADNLYYWFVRGVESEAYSPFTDLTTGGTNQSSGSFTLANGSLVYIEFYMGSGIADGAIKNIQIEGGTSATAYTPYTCTEIPITWESIAGTVYGGTLDVVSGVLTVDRALITIDGTENIRNNGRTTIAQRAIINISGKASGISNMQSDKFAVTATADAVGKMIGRAASDLVEFFLPLDGTADTAASCKQWFANNNTQLVYELATPQTYQLTPTEVRTLLGENLVYSDADDVTVNYYVDMKGYIDKRLNTTRMMIAGVETSFVATKNYAIGDFVIVNDTLYRITAVITSGETITLGTNASETTVAEQLIALYNA